MGRHASCAVPIVGPIQGPDVTGTSRNPSRPSLRPRASGLFDRPAAHPGMPNAGMPALQTEADNPNDWLVITPSFPGPFSL